MQLIRFEKLNLFFAKIRELTLWQRIFFWRSVRSLSYDAFEEFKSLEQNILRLKSEFEELQAKSSRISTQNEGLQERIIQFEKAEIKKDSEINTLDREVDELNNTITQLNKSLSKYETTEEDRLRKYEDRISQLNQLKETLENEIKRLNDERVHEKERLFQNMKRQWAEHQTSVEKAIKMICQDHLIKYIDKVPFYGNPDNTIEICNEYVIFDAKSPGNDDLTNFPKYLRAQTENLKKYVDQENVKKDIYLVVPSNTIDLVDQLIYNMGDYKVYIIAKDSLEPIILSLKRIEDYEFAEQLSPEERENICRVIGKFAHTTKRKIQIDQFFANEFLELLVKCKNDLPEEILKQVIEYEKAEKLNPPSEKKSKQILTKDLQENHQLINAEAHIKGIAIPTTLDQLGTSE
jgi:hypothetical protein